MNNQPMGRATPARILRGDKNQCPTCGEYFNSTRAFDKHRTGAWPSLASDGKWSAGERRCKTTQEMLSAGMTLSSTNWWITCHRPQLTGG